MSVSATQDRDGLGISKRFGWDEFDKLRKAIFICVKKFKHKNISLNFKQTEIIYPNGITPLIALAEYYRKIGVAFSIVPPLSVELNRLASFEGWFHALDPNRFGAPSKSGYNSLPLMRYANDDELNIAVNSAIEVALRNLSMAKSVPEAFEWALNELAGNVLHHSEGDGGYIQMNMFRSAANLSIVVADAGIGVPASMRQEFKDLPNDRIAVETAVQKGITSKPNFGQGNGLAGSLALALKSDGYFALTSGGGRLVVDKGVLTVRDFYPALQGTVVELQLPTDREIDIPGALWGHSPSSYIEERFENDSGSLCLKLNDCALTFGNRLTGEKIRTMIINLLTSNPSSGLDIDFDGVKIIASSFADEVFGKLFLELGPLEYGARIRPSRVNGVCKQIIDRAILERVAQGL